MFTKLFDRTNEKSIDEMLAESVARTEDAIWHISYYSDRDKEWVEKLMKELGCKKFKMYPTIDECLEPFKIS